MGRRRESARRVGHSVRHRLHFLDDRSVVGGVRIELTVSVGVVSSTAVQSDVSNLKERADEALYSAKRGGRDRVRVWDPALHGVSGFVTDAKVSRRSGVRHATSTAI